ncbi:recombinase family protein [Candidatus Tisiphia endosymbiont of Nedyus quadrimaculatus]|uniref:recombinase family protein n=1 Tax=unclassified Candidatus Tisiphia TaxID=2996318 RepID=UPI00345E6741
MTDILGYARVSTQQQDLDSQRHRLKKAGAIKIFEDVISGRIFERPGLEELIAYARPNDLLCIVRLDRLGRSLKELLETVEYLKENKIGLMSLEEKIDTSSAAGELVFHVFGAIAHFERRLISERTKEGINAARLKGKTPGRPNLDKEKLDAALRLIKTGISPTNAAKQLQIGRSTIYRELKYTQ